MAEYARTIKKLSDHGFRVLRVWCPPWAAEQQRPQGHASLAAHLAWRGEYFGRLLEVAALHGVSLILCMFSHVELADRRWFDEVADRRFTWEGNPFNSRKQGPCSSPSQFFSDPQAKQAVQQWFHSFSLALGSHKGLLALELFNEPDRVDGFDLAEFLGWVRFVRPALAGRAGSSPVTVSLADATNHAALWSSEEIDLIQFHTYSWPLPDPIDSIWHFQNALGHLSKPSVCGEFGWDSQRGFTDEQVEMIPSVIAASFATGSSIGALPWWWNDLVDRDGLLGRITLLAEFLDTITVPTPPRRFVLSVDSSPIGLATSVANLARKASRIRLFLEPSAWARAFRGLTSLGIARLQTPQAFGCTNGREALIFIRKGAKAPVRLPSWELFGTRAQGQALLVQSGLVRRVEACDGELLGLGCPNDDVLVFLGAHGGGA